MAILGTAGEREAVRVGDVFEGFAFEVYLGQSVSWCDHDCRVWRILT